MTLPARPAVNSSKRACSVVRAPSRPTNTALLASIGRRCTVSCFIEQPSRPLRASKAFEGEGFGLAKAKQRANKLACLVGDEDLAGSGRGLQPLRQMHCVADCRVD